jgi:6-pyruvoyltetrahydropterin/6-carboxytetrahydropterin synthase
MLYVIEKTFKFEASHHLGGLPEGHKCARNHGHGYKVTIELTSSALDETGFVTDFANLAPVGRYIDTTLDHEDLNELRARDAAGNDRGPLLPQPSSELLAKHLYEVAVRDLPVRIGHMISAVRVSETDTSSATYRPEPTP